MKFNPFLFLRDNLIWDIGSTFSVIWVLRKCSLAILKWYWLVRKNSSNVLQRLRIAFSIAGKSGSYSSGINFKSSTESKVWINSTLFSKSTSDIGSSHLANTLLASLDKLDTTSDRVMVAYLSSNSNMGLIANMMTMNLRSPPVLMSYLNLSGPLILPNSDVYVRGRVQFMQLAWFRSLCRPRSTCRKALKVV